MDLRQRLRRIMERQGARGGEQAPVSRASSPAPAGGGPSFHGRVRFEREGAGLPGAEAEGAGGRFWLRTVDLSLDHVQGARRLGEGLDLRPDTASFLGMDPRLDRFDPRDALFLDTETTALGGGAGVYVFLAGVGFFQGDRFRVEQYFMRDFHEEEAMLSALNNRLEGFGTLVTFFGKNFDRWRLEDRMTTLGMVSRLPADRHLDLFYAARRLFRGRYPDLRLKTLEEGLLGFHREDDLPGAECPEAYFAWLRGQDRNRLAAVFRHNLLDILSLVVLAVELEARVRNPRSTGERYAAARLHLHRGEEERALRLLEGIETEKEGEAFLEGGLLRVRLLKRQGCLAALERALAGLLRRAPRDPRVLLEAAKFHEHRRKDYAAALAYAERARRALLGDRDAGPWGPARTVKAVEHRIARLRRKGGRG